MPAIKGADNNADQSWLDRLMKDSPQDFFGEGKVQMDKTEESEWIRTTIENGVETILKKW